MDLTNLLAVAVPMAAAIAVFFWSLDRVRKERSRPEDTQRAPRATPRELVERLLRPAAENLSLRRTAEGKPTLTEDLARAGLNITPAEYLLIRIGAVALGALIGLLRFGISIGPIVIAALGFVIPPLVVNYLQRRRQNMFNEQLTGMLQLLSNSLKTGYAIDRALETVATKSHRCRPSSSAWPPRSPSARRSRTHSARCCCASTARTWNSSSRRSCCTPGSEATSPRCWTTSPTRFAIACKPSAT